MLTDNQKKNVLLVSTHKLVQKHVVEGMFDCMSRSDTSVSDIWEYIEDEDYPDFIRNALSVILRMKKRVRTTKKIRMPLPAASKRNSF